MRLPKTIPVDILSDPRALYDFFMKHIEPDLVSGNLATLDVPYSKETAEERKTRYSRYSAAYLVLDEVMQEFMADVESKTHGVASAMDLGAAADDIESGTEELSSLDQKIQNQ